MQIEICFYECVTVSETLQLCLKGGGGSGGPPPEKKVIFVQLIVQF